MTVKFAKRAAGELLGRGESSIRINTNSIEDAKKAMTKEDVRKMIKDGGIFAIKEKHNLSYGSKLLKKRREKGRRRGAGKRRGTHKARAGEPWMKKVRSQREFLKELRSSGKVDGATFKRFYSLIRGNVFTDKKSMLLHLNEQGIKFSDDEVAAINERIRKRWNE
jgi:large subunit ribosomal protein L19e